MIAPLPSYRPLGNARCSRCGGTHAMMRSPTGAIVAEPCGGRGAPKVKPADAGLAAEVALAERMNAAGLVGWESQFYWALDERSAKGRPIQYRSDFAFVKARLLVESEGGAHTVRRQYEADCRRASLAAALGWRMVRASKEMIVDGTAVALIARALGHTAQAGKEG